MGKFRKRQPARSHIGGDPEIDQLDVVLRVHHDVFRLQIAMHHAVPVNVFERRGNLHCDLHRAPGGKLALLVHDLAKQPPFHPFHRHVNLGVVGGGINLHHSRMIKLFANLLLAVKAFKEDRVSFHFRMRNFNGHGFAGILVGGAKNRRHAAVSHQVFNQVLIEFVASMK